MSTQKIPLRREMRLAQLIQPSLALPIQAEADDQRRRIVVRWLELTRRTLPAMAAAQRWPIRLDHCFMRVMLDNAVGGVWHDTIPRPAIRHIAPEPLQRAIDLAERVTREPTLLPELNRRSLAWRRRDRL